MGKAGIAIAKFDWLDSNGNIWASTHNSSGGYSIIKFPYSAGKTIDGKSQTPIASFDDMVRVNYDATKDYIGYTEADFVQPPFANRLEP